MENKENETLVATQIADTNNCAEIHRAFCGWCAELKRTDLNDKQIEEANYMKRILKAAYKIRKDKIREEMLY